jgi:hypothetical protein
VAVVIGKAQSMNQPASPQIGRHQQAGRLWRFARAVRDIVAECAYAQRRMTEIMTAPDSYLFNRDAAPDTYGEFLFRTSGLLRHEPPTRSRASR